MRGRSNSGERASTALQPALRILPAEMQLVHTRTRRCVPFSVTMRADWRFGRQTRLVLLLAWLTLFPLRGPFPQTAQKAIGKSPGRFAYGMEHKPENLSTSAPRVNPCRRIALV